MVKDGGIWQRKSKIMKIMYIMRYIEEGHICNMQFGMDSA